MDYRTDSIIFPQKAYDFCDCSDGECAKTGIQYANVSTTVDIAPCVKIGEIETECLGAPEVCCSENQCKESCKVVITQKIRIKIPIQYSFKARVGESDVDCCDKPRCE